MKTNIELTFSKLMALLIFIASVVLSYTTERGADVFLAALATIAILVPVKQYMDRNKPKES